MRQMKFQNIIFTLSAIVVGILISPGPHAYGKGDNQLKAYLWKNRPLILFSQSPDSPAYRPVLDSLSAYQDEIAERHMVIIEIFENGLVRSDGKYDSQLNAMTLRQYFSAQKGQLTSILIGKDGTLKLRQKYRLHLVEIFSVIDRMPMRQQEMRKGVE